MQLFYQGLANKAATTTTAVGTVNGKDYIKSLRTLSSSNFCGFGFSWSLFGHSRSGVAHYGPQAKWARKSLISPTIFVHYT